MCVYMHIYIYFFAVVQLLSHMCLFVTSGTVARQAPQSIGLSRQEYWSGFPFPSPIYIYMYVCVCVYTHIYLHLYVYIYETAYVWV